MVNTKITCTGLTNDARQIEVRMAIKFCDNINLHFFLRLSNILRIFHNESSRPWLGYNFYFSFSNFLYSSRFFIFVLFSLLRFSPSIFTGNVEVEPHPRSSTLAGERLINHNGRLESEQQRLYRSMLFADLFLRHQVNNRFCVRVRKFFFFLSKYPWEKIK